MSTITKRYAAQCLSGSGFAILDSRIAWQLRPDLWASGQDCAMSGWAIEVPGTVRISVEIAGYGRVRILTRSTDNLARRIEWIVGAKVEHLEEVSEAEKPSDHQVEWRSAVAARAEAERLEKLRALAAQELPSHECHLRKEILRAREEVARIGG